MATSSTPQQNIPVDNRGEYQPPPCMEVCERPELIDDDGWEVDDYDDQLAGEESERLGGIRE